MPLYIEKMERAQFKKNAQIGSRITILENKNKSGGKRQGSPGRGGVVSIEKEGVSFRALHHLSSFPDKQDVSSNVLGAFCIEWIFSKCTS